MQFEIPDRNIMVEFVDEATGGPMMLNLSQIQLVRPAATEPHAVQIQTKSGEFQWIHGDYEPVLEKIRKAIEEA